jgi:glycosyltransferase involved in cell wall biosynthesis
MRALSVAMTVDPEIPVPPTHYGGIERIVGMLIDGLLTRGHQVTLFAHPDSRVSCDLRPYPRHRSRAAVDLCRNAWHVSSHVLKGRYDVVHSFARLAYLLALLPLSIPKLMSYQRVITPGRAVWGERLARGTLHFAGCSRRQIEAFAGKRNWHVVHNAASASTYHCRDRVEEDAPLVYLGRIEAIKGAHVAVEAARRSGRTLVIAGNVPDHDAATRYFQEKILPSIDGTTIRYVGPVTDAQKNDLLGTAAALLMPIAWDEPFGIVAAEALACGTPVIAFRRGALPEIVQEGVNGFLCGTIDEMAAAVGRIATIDRKTCRRIMEERFSDHALVDSYERLYQELAGVDG